MRRVPKQARSRSIVESIVEATSHVLHLRDYESASTNQVAEKAGVSVGSLYQYFPNKDSILDLLASRVVDRRIKEFERNFAAASTLPPSQMLDRIVDFICDEYFRDRKMMK